MIDPAVRLMAYSILYAGQLPVLMSSCPRRPSSFLIYVRLRSSISYEMLGSPIIVFRTFGMIAQWRLTRVRSHFDLEAPMGGIEISQDNEAIREGRAERAHWNALILSPTDTLRDQS